MKKSYSDVSHSFYITLLSHGRIVFFVSEYVNNLTCVYLFTYLIKKKYMLKGLNLQILTFLC